MDNKQILIVAPSLSPACVNKAVYQRAAQNLAKFGYAVRWAPNAARALEDSVKDRFESTPLEDKLADFEWALEQPGQIILAALGGFDSYQLLGGMPFKKLAAAGKILVGHSDPTLLLNAYYAETGVVSWYGSNLRNFGEKETGLLAAKNFAAALSSKQVNWRRASVYKDDFRAPLRAVRNWTIIQPGKATGVGIGGNIGSLYLLQGTRYMPAFNQPTILFLEEDDMPGQYTTREFDRRLRSLLDQPGAGQNVQGLLVGRFLDSAKVTMGELKAVIEAIPALVGKPVIANVEIGHGMPRIMLPVGGKIRIDTIRRQIITN